jgi:hypothetical protein
MRLLHEVRDLVRVERLGHVVIRAVLQRGDGGFDRGIAGHDDDQQLGIDFVHAALQLDAIGAVHLDIDQRRIPALCRELGQRVVGVFQRWLRRSLLRGTICPASRARSVRRPRSAVFPVCSLQSPHLHCGFPVADGCQRSVQGLTGQSYGKSRAPAQPIHSDAPLVPLHDAAS